LILQSLAVEDAEQKVIHQLLEFAHSMYRLSGDHYTLAYITFSMRADDLALLTLSMSVVEYHSF
jgi:hypothetical protein